MRKYKVHFYTRNRSTIERKTTILKYLRAIQAREREIERERKSKFCPYFFRESILMSDSEDDD
jgi:hypothetical protein